MVSGASAFSHPSIPTKSGVSIRAEARSAANSPPVSATGPSTWDSKERRLIMTISVRLVCDPRSGHDNAQRISL